MQKRNRNSLMHATNGNGFFLYFLLSLLMALVCSMCNACATCCDLRFLVNVAGCIVSLQCAMSLSKAKKLKTRRVPCRIVGKRRFHAAHLHKRRYSSFCKLICLLCLVSPFTMVCIRANALVTNTLGHTKESFLRPISQKKKAQYLGGWALSRKDRNRLVHSMNGNPDATNTPQERTRWESTPEHVESNSTLLMSLSFLEMQPLAS